MKRYRKMIINTEKQQQKQLKDGKDKETNEISQSQDMKIEFKLLKET